MTAPDPDSDLRRLGDALRASAAADLAREEQRARPTATPATRRRRRGVLAGASLALAGAAAAVVVLVVGGSEGAPPAYAVTRIGDGSVLIQISDRVDIAGANAKLRSMRTHEVVTIINRPGLAKPGPVTCRAVPGARPAPTGPKIRVLEDGRATAAHPAYHLAACWVFSDRHRGSFSPPYPG